MVYNRTSLADFSHTMTHILVLPKNSVGNDKLIGDVHGNGDLLAIVLAKISSQDRLFIVGDLFDRGSNPLLVFRLLQQYSNIYVARGNHEDLLLGACRPDAVAHDVASCLLNGGQWIFVQNTPEDIAIRACLKAYKEGLSHDQDAETPQLDEEYLQQLFLKAPKIAELDQILNYIRTLPYIIQIGQPQEYGFVVCHADLPFSDITLQSMIENQTPLTSAQIEHITWAREHSNELRDTHGPFFATRQRSEQSMFVFCGHNMIYFEATCIRENTNHINLDSGAYLHDCFVVVNYTAGQATAVFLKETPGISVHSEIFFRAKYQRVAQYIAIHLKEHLLLPQQNNLIRVRIGAIQTSIEEWRLCKLSETGDILLKNQRLIQGVSESINACLVLTHALEDNVLELDNHIRQCQDLVELALYGPGNCCSAFWCSKSKVANDPSTVHLEAIENNLALIRRTLEQIEYRKCLEENSYSPSYNLFPMIG